ncbi:MAG: beta-N-acetylhexosaminidase [Bdellovibrionaceae bacterium]|nr:beta-N-acetylhexosaminidase [Pseudobdellovibrionaceae bacterium]
MGDLFRRLARTFIVASTAFVVSAESFAAPQDSPSTKGQSESLAEPLAPADAEWLANAPLRAKVGQLFIFGFMGTDLSRGLAHTIRTHRPGAIIIFGRNIKSARQLIELNFNAQKEALKASGVPLLIAVDQEGGSVIRIRTSPPLPSALALGEAGSPELVYEAGVHTGRLLKTLGFNMNLAPVLDVADPRTDPFVGTRSYGKDPMVVAAMGTQFSAGLDAVGVLPTAKHFPGHGGVADTHKSTPLKNVSLDSLTKIDLVPFSEGFRELPNSAVMLAHIAYPKVDPSGMPATFSKPIVTQLLREKLKFNGLVITDDIEMAGAFVVKDPAERALRAIEAGADLVMVAWNRKLQTRAIEAVLKAVKTGRISQARLNESLHRILRAKRKVAPPTGIERPTTEVLQAVMKNEDLHRLALDTLHRQFAKASSQMNKKEVLQDPERPIFVFASTESFYRSLKNQLSERSARFYRLTNSKNFDINRVLRSNPDAVAVMHIGGTQSAKYANQMDADNASRTIVVNSETSNLLKDPSAFQKVIDVHFRHPELGKITAQYLFDRVPPTPILVAQSNGRSKDRQPAQTEPESKKEAGDPESQPEN